MHKTMPSINSTISDWFPWITNDGCNLLDRNLSRKIEDENAQLTRSDALVALKWYSHLPSGYRTKSDELVAGTLQQFVNSSFDV